MVMAVAGGEAGAISRWEGSVFAIRVKHCTYYEGTISYYFKWILYIEGK